MGKVVMVKQGTDCHWSWWNKFGIVVDTEADALTGELLWNVKMETNDAPVAFAAHELEEMN